ncbi:MAG: hypothetical protein EOP56_11680 [Sphingobacteriales bacterium]|nr:MAG: hypothetical protein EOP56_11680 [Sphingobacteriales bacterium]
MRYYIDTNILYNLKKVPQGVIKNAYTSSFALMEIISGINEKDYNRRKACLKEIFTLNLDIDNRMPSGAIYGGFSIFREFKMTDSRVNLLKEAIRKCVVSSSFKEIESAALDVSGVKIELFSKLDREISDNFVDLRQGVNNIMQEGGPQFIEINRQQHRLDTSAILRELFSVNSGEERMRLRLIDNLVSVVIININTSKALDKPRFERDEISKSYNGLLDNFITGQIRYFSSKLGVIELPGKNDSQDLYHLFYLRPGDKIISDDKFFKKYLPESSITLNELIEQI